MNCQFSVVDLNFTYFYSCEFTNLNFSKIQWKGISFVDPKPENISSNGLVLYKDNTMQIKITNSSVFSKKI